ncbi:MAG TPA: 4-hydroxy-tetrahydrodipicolinate reductase [Desulfomonilia bacterium]|nr:4-hydroxy-tetrahydrodipicolinate reductase [Desulfomonilia bacterium]
MIKTGVVGFGGRMGSLIARTIMDSPDLVLEGALEDKAHPAVGRDVGEMLGSKKTGIKVAADLGEAFVSCDCIVDFTFPEVTLATLRYASEKGKSVVIGSTGFTEEQKKSVASSASMIPVVLSPNMSIGVNVLLNLVGMMAGLLDETYDVEIVEAHHRLKKDAPSGTALALAQAVARGRGVELDEHARYERHGIIGVRPQGEIGIQTVRAGDIVGEHVVMFAGPGERIEITHKAHSRENFARGALRAVRWLKGKGPGLYSMMDVLGISHENR